MIHRRATSPVARAAGRLAVATLAAASWLGGCGSSERATGGAGASAGSAVIAAMTAAATIPAPWRCAALPASDARGELGVDPGRWQREGAVVRAVSARPRLVIAAVAQARGAALPTRLREALVAERPDLILALGGMGDDQASLERSLSALAVDGALVVAVPGDAEAWPALAAAVDALGARGLAVVDGARVRLLDGGAAVVGTLPGLAHTARLGAGADGCAHDDVDVSATLTMMAEAAGDRPRVLAAARAPQGASPREVHDLRAGVHAGDRALTDALAGASLTAIVHGLVGRPSPSGQAARGGGAAIAGGSLDPIGGGDDAGRPLPARVTFAVVDRDGVAWRAIATDAW